VSAQDKALIGQFFAVALGAEPADPLARELADQIERRESADALWLEGWAVAAVRRAGQVAPGVAARAPARAPARVPDDVSGRESTRAWSDAPAGTQPGGLSGLSGDTPGDESADRLGELAAIAALTEALTEEKRRRQAQAAAQREAADRARRDEESQAADRLRAERRRAARRPLIAALAWRAAVALAYSLLGGWLLARDAFFAQSFALESGLVFVCALTAAVLSALVDWLLGSPRGRLRKASAVVGAVFAGAVWLDAFDRPHLSRADIWAGPLVFATAWIIGAVLTSGLRRLTEGRPLSDPSGRSAAKPPARPATMPLAQVSGQSAPQASGQLAATGSVPTLGSPLGDLSAQPAGHQPAQPAGHQPASRQPADPAGRPPAEPHPYASSMAVRERIAAAFRRAAVARAWVWLAVAPALAAGAAGMVFDACGADCAPARQTVFAWPGAQSVLPLDLADLPAHPWLVAVAAAAAWLVHLASRPLMRVRWRLGWAALGTGLAMALLVLATSPDSPAAWLADLIAHLASG
jgi:hypothetical protein